MSGRPNKTSATQNSVSSFLASLENKKRVKDAQIICELMESITNEEPTMWGPSIVGFGNYHYKYDSGREGDFFKVGFSPRKQNLSLYIMPGFSAYEALMEKLGKYKTGKSCLYVNKLEDVDLDVLKEIITKSYDAMTEKYG